MVVRRNYHVLVACVRHWRFRRHQRGILRRMKSNHGGGVSVAANRRIAGFAARGYGYGSGLKCWHAVELCRDGGYVSLCRIKSFPYNTKLSVAPPRRTLLCGLCEASGA